MTEKNLEALIIKIVKKVIKKEIKNFSQDNLPIVANQGNQQLESLLETLEEVEEIGNTSEIIDDLYTSRVVTVSTKEDMELDRKLRELKFRQELRKDWILFIIKDVIVYPTTVLFIFAMAGFYLFTFI